MAEKRRAGSTQVAAFIVALTIVILLWRHADCPGRPYFTSEPPGYLLVLPSNATSLPPPYAMRSLPSGDLQRLVDLSDFEFTMTNMICNGSDPLVVVLVHSDPRNFNKRTAIRITWGSQLKVLFLLGRPRDHELQLRLEAENEGHHDLVQGSFLDVYRNLTYKHVMALKWISYHCPSARYLLKTDDDVFVHPAALVHYLRNSLSPHGARRLILCDPFPYGLVMRSYRSKWRVSYTEYPGRVYPAYCQGWGVLYSPDVVFRLYLESQAARYFWIDDVFVTGLMAARANFARSPLGNLVLTDKRMAELPNKAPHEDFFIFGPSNLSVEDLYSLWATVSKWQKHAIPS